MYGTSVISILATPSSSVITEVVFPFIVKLTTASEPTAWPSPATTLTVKYSPLP